MIKGVTVSTNNTTTIFVKKAELIVMFWTENRYRSQLRVCFQLLERNNPVVTTCFAAFMKLSRSFAKIFFAFQATESRGVFSSQASQSCVPVCSVCPACSLGASFTMSNNAKFFKRPWTPVGTATACLHLGQSMLLPWSSLSKQLKQKLSTTQKPRTFFFVIVTFITDWTLWSLERHCLKKSTFFTNEWRGNYHNNKKSEKALSQIWHVFVDPLKHCLCIVLCNLCIILPYCYAKSNV